MREKDIERKLVTHVMRLGGLAWKFVSPGTAGVPDRLILLPNGQMAFAEVKAPGQQLRLLQVRRKRQLEKLGFRVYVIDDPEKIKEIKTEGIKTEGIKTNGIQTNGIQTNGKQNGGDAK